jgi:hypothetical protein
MSMRAAPFINGKTLRALGTKGFEEGIYKLLLPWGALSVHEATRVS